MHTYMTSYAFGTAIGNFNRAVKAVSEKLDKLDKKADKH